MTERWGWIAAGRVDTEILAVLGQNKPADEACHELIDLALQAGGSANVTVIVARHKIPSDAG